MCDTVVVVGEDGVLFAKNSDRDPNEAQILEWHDSARHEPGAQLHATWITIPQVAATHAVVISRPWWMWGAEMGANEHGVTIGNEAVFTTQPTENEPGLLGMDLLRLALERSADADAAVETIVSLLERHGQAGPCSHENPAFSYHNSFLVADPGGAIVLETAGRRWATERVRSGARSISNGLTIDGFAQRHADRLRGTVAQFRRRSAVTAAGARAARSPLDLMAALRDNGTGGAPRWSLVNGSMKGPNMHAGGLVTSSQTVASWVGDLRSEPLHWATATADPAVSLFKPVRVGEPIDPGPAPTNRFDPRTLWWRHELLHRAALADWSRAVDIVGTEQRRIESAWVSEPPSTADAFARASAIHQRWYDEVLAGIDHDTRPWWVRQLWRHYDRSAGLRRPPGVSAPAPPMPPRSTSSPAGIPVGSQDRVT